VTNRHPASPLTAFSVSLVLAGCVVSPSTLAPAATPGGVDTQGVTTGRRPSGGTLLTKPKAGDAAGLEKLRSEGRVQIAFRGLAASRPTAPLVAGRGAGMRTLRELLQTTDQVARVEVTLTGPKGYVRTQSLTRAELMVPMVTMFFEGVPVGGATLAARVFDAGGAGIGAGEQRFDVRRGEVTEVALRIKLGATGGVGAAISFEDADVPDTNISGFWVVGAGREVPPYPMTGCGQGYVWNITQYGSSLRAVSSGYNEPGHPSHPGMYWAEEAYGTIRGDRVKLSGRVVYTDAAGQMAAAVEEAAYELVFDRARWQLVGTRNGEQGWAVPYHFEPGCDGGLASPPPLTPLPGVAPVEAIRFIGLEGAVRTYDGLPAAGAWVDVWRAEGGLVGRVQAGPDGRYALPDVPADVLLEVNATLGDASVQHYTRIFDLNGGKPAGFDMWLEQPAAPLPVVSAPPPTGRTQTVTGTVRDESGAPVDGATLMLRSLDPSVPYSVTVPCRNGAYVIEDVPEGVNVEAVATKPGHTRRRRVTSFYKPLTGQPHNLDFGAVAGDHESEGAAFFISDQPEIERTSPANDDRGLADGTLACKLELSEPIPPESRKALEQAFTIVPLNAAAAGVEVEDLSDLRSPMADDLSDFAKAWVLRVDGSTGAGRTATVTSAWDPTGSVVTFTIAPRLPRFGGSEPPRYGALLFRGEGPTAADDGGNDLGVWPPGPGGLVHHAFKDQDLYLAGPKGFWRQTHLSATRFSLRAP
jgi:hypothetical protein